MSNPLITIFELFSQASPEGWFVILFLILPCFLGTLLTLLVFYGRLLHDQVQFHRFQEEIRQYRQEGRRIEESDIHRWREEWPRDSLTSRLVVGLWSVRPIANPDLEAVAAVLRQSELGRLAAVRIIPNILLLFGLLGTVFGLAGAVGTLGPQIKKAFQTTNPQELIQNLEGTLQNMGTAFSCTLWGILTAAVIAGVMSFVMHRQDRLLAEVQEFGLKELAPLCLPRSQEILLEDIRHVLGEGQAFLSRVAEIMAISAKQFDEVLNNAGQAMNNAGQAMTESLHRLQKVAEGIQNTLIQVSQEVQDSTSALVQTTEEVRQSTESLRGYHTDLRNAYVELRNLFDESQQKLEEQVKDQIEQISQLQQRFRDTADQILLRVDGVSERLSESTRAFQDAGDQFVRSGSEIQDRLDLGFQRVMEGVGGTLEDHRREIGHVEDRLGFLIDQLGELMRRLDPRLLSAEEWQEVKSAMRACAEGIQGLLQQTSSLALRPSQGRGLVGEGYPPPGVTEINNISLSLREVVDHLKQIQRGIESLRYSFSGDIKELGDSLALKRQEDRKEAGITQAVFSSPQYYEEEVLAPQDWGLLEKIFLWPSLLGNHWLRRRNLRR